MAISNRSLTCRGFAAAFLFLAPAWPLLGQQQGLPPAGTPDVPPPITVVTTTPGDPGDPGNPPGTPGGPGGPGGNPTPTVTTPAPSEPKDMKDMKDMKSSITYHTTPNDYFSIFLSGSGTHGDMGNSTDPGHYYYDRAQGNLGVEYHFAGDWTIGTILSYAHIDSAFGNFDASSTVDSYLPSLFVSYYHEGWWAYLSTTDGYDTFTEDRGTVNGTAHGAGDGWQYGGKLVGGYLFHSGPWSYGPVGDLHGYQLNASGFTESGAGASDLHFNSEGTYTLQSQFGGLVRYDTEFLGASVQPYFSASWQREWGNANEAITGNTSGGASFSTRSVYLDRDAALLDLGVRASVSTDVGVFLGWEGVVGGNYLTNTAEGGVDISF
jgi:uncharacterized protein YhjY with autotransporter beta-barrel domain